MEKIPSREGQGWVIAQALQVVALAKAWRRAEGTGQGAAWRRSPPGRGQGWVIAQALQAVALAKAWHRAVAGCWLNCIFVYIQ